MAKSKTPELSIDERILIVTKLIEKEMPGVEVLRGSEVNVEIAATGVEPLDAVCKGFRRGGYSILWGPPGSGKSTLALIFIGEEQKRGKLCMLADIENRFDPVWAESNGVDIKNLLVLRKGSSLEDNLTAIEKFLRAGIIETLVIDSLTALVPEQELKSSNDKEKTIHDNNRGVQARKMSEWFRRTTPVIAQKDICVVLIGQGRTEGLNSGMARLGLSGGLAQKYYASTVLRMYTSNTGAPSKTIGDKKIYLGFIMHVILDKTSLTGHQGTEVQLPFVFGLGLDISRNDIDQAVISGIIDGTSKGWFSWLRPDGEEIKIHGREKLYTFFKDEEQLAILKKQQETTITVT